MIIAMVFEVMPDGVVDDYVGGMGGSVARALAFHRCNPGSILARVICELRFLSVVLSHATMVFPRVLRFSSVITNQHSELSVESCKGGVEE